MGVKQMIRLLDKVILGGIEQWILVRGINAQNPIILFLHGGPGLPMMPFHQHFQNDIEKKYLVVHWDQRGAGKSYSENIPIQSMNLSQILSDAHDLVILLKQRYGKDKIYLAGHSWGSIIGMNLINLYPEDFYGFISIGQVVNFSQSLNISNTFALEKAKEQGCEEVVNELIKIGEPPFNEDDTKLSIILKNVGRFGGRMHNEISFSSIAKRCCEYTENDIKNIPKGLNFSDTYLWSEVIKTNMMDNLLDFKVPVYFVCGKYDYITPTILIEEYCKKITAQFKKVIILENSAHYPYIEEPDKFSQLIINILEDN
jgi:pimeloyl-ACP methyl ester carboxylesterase